MEGCSNSGEGGNDEDHPKKKGPGDVIDVSWVTGKFYFFLVTNDVFLGTNFNY